MYFECTRFSTLRKLDWIPRSLVNLMITKSFQALDLRAFRQVGIEKDQVIYVPSHSVFIFSKAFTRHLHT